MVNDVDAAVAFYTMHFGFKLLSNAAPAFADVVLGDLRVVTKRPDQFGGTTNARRPTARSRRMESVSTRRGRHRRRGSPAPRGRLAVPQRDCERTRRLSDFDRRPFGQPN